MAREFLAVQGQELESDHLVLGLEVRRVESEGNVHITESGFGNELGLGCDRVAVGIEELLLGDLAVLVGDLLVEGAGNLVALDLSMGCTYHVIAMGIGRSAMSASARSESSEPNFFITSTCA